MNENKIISIKKIDIYLNKNIILNGQNITIYIFLFN